MKIRHKILTLVLCALIMCSLLGCSLYRQAPNVDRTPTVPAAPTTPTVHTPATEATEPAYTSAPPTTEPSAPAESYLLKILRADQSIFAQPNYDSQFKGTVEVAGTYTIVEESTDDEGNLWGKLKSGAGWVDITEIRAFEKNPTPTTANYADKTLLGSGNFHHCIADTSEYNTQIAIRATEKLTNVSFYSIVFTETFDKGEELYHLDQLTPSKPLVADVLFAGDMSMFGISFTDADGAVCQYLIYVSGRNGTLVMTEP